MKSHRHIQLHVAARGPFERPPRVAVAGEISAWDTPLPVDVHIDDDGIARGTLPLALPPGMFAYKLIVNGQWQLDAQPLRTRSEQKRRNHILAVGGTPEPVLFAPGRPWLAESSRGGVRLVAALRRGHGDTLCVHWREPADADDHVTSLAPVAEEDEHILFETRLPVSSGRIQLRFGLADGTVVGDAAGAPLEWQAPSDATPPWWRQAVVYTIFVDRFRPRAMHPQWEVDPGPQKYAGGHLDGVTLALPALAEIGVDVLYLTPIHEGANCHRYDMVDPAHVDVRLGGEPALERLLQAAHARGMRVVLDFSCAHAGNGFVPYEDVKVHGKASRYASWFQWLPNRSALRHYGTRTDAPLFNMQTDDVRAYFVDLVRQWAARGIDGLRLDAAAEVPFEWAREFRQVFRSIRPDGVVFGEFVHPHTYRFLDEDAGDAATEFGFHDVVVPFLAEAAVDAAHVAKRLSALEWERGAPPHRAVRFLCTHDHPRLATLARFRGRSHLVPLGFLMLFTLPGVPMLLYGEELGLFALRPEHTRENVWPDRMPMPWSTEAHAVPLRAIVAALAALRARTPTFVDGALLFVHGEGDVLVFRREAAGDVIDVALNTGAEVDVVLDDDDLPEAELLFHVGPALLQGQIARLGPGGGVVVRRRASEAQRRLHMAGNVVLRDRDFASSVLLPKSRPSRIDVAITERCNLRCAHCITHAPERTALRQARALSPWMLDRLRDDLAHAEHVGFVHGGEPLVSPLLDTMLDTIRDVRAGFPTVVHLLTNGVLLSAATAERLAGRGVNSISVSLDGATADVNDAIREGGRFVQVIDNLRNVVAWRRAAGVDVRLGVSAVVLSQNVGQLDMLVDLCADVGVDWLKLEEGVPATAFAERSLVRLDHGVAADAVVRACERARARGLVVVNHTIDRPVWRCRLQADTDGAAFLEADGYANRAFIHPCRGPWEIACVEANGDVRIGHFFGPVLGNVAHAPLAALWNGDAAAAARQDAISSRLCKEGPVECMKAC